MFEGKGTVLLNKKEYLVNLLQHTSGHNSFMRYMTEINSASLEKYILSLLQRRSIR